MLVAAFLSLLCRNKSGKFVKTVVDDDLDLALRVKDKIQTIYTAEIAYLRMYNRKLSCCYYLLCCDVRVYINLYVHTAYACFKTSNFTI